MAFHFPLMPRMYMAIAQEDRHPITDILRQTPEIPDLCQWAVFLRNHDELTLEMVTENEREYLWNTYATDRRMRINLGIRRRLAPLMQNDRRKIELMNGLLLSMPGTPVIYYGDEIGMGDNIYLGDRDGVRTPMQWSPDRNAGFSRAHPQRLFLPPIMDPIYGYEAVNVEAQSQNPTSLLNWMKRMIGVRQARHAFGRGTLTFLYPRNRKILAYVREYEDEVILCTFNLSRNAQAFDLDLSRFRDRVPIELLGRTEFPPVPDAPYRLTLPGHGFYWFVLTQPQEVPAWQEPTPEPLPEFITVVVVGGYKAITDGRGGRDLAQQVLPEYLPKQRWFAAKDHKLAEIGLRFTGEFADHGDGYLLSEVEVTPVGGERQQYLLPLALTWGEEHLAHGSALLPYTLAKVRRGPRVGVLHDATQSDDFIRRLAKLMYDGAELSAGESTVQAVPGSRREELELSPEATVRRFGVEQSNTSVLLEDKVIVKAYRRLQPGVHPELEMARFLTEVAGYENTPPLLGSVEKIAADGQPTAYAAAFGFVANQGDGWRWTLDYLDRTLEEIRLTGDGDGIDPAERHAPYLTMARLLGQRTAEMHRALAIDTNDPAFVPEPVTQEDVEGWVAAAREQVENGFATLERAEVPGASTEALEAALAARPAVEEALEAVGEVPQGLMKTRLHGDYHLGQVLVAKGDFMILDFEGEPVKPVEVRRAKSSPLRDVAGMLRSFDYAAWASLFRFAESDAAALDALLAPALVWRNLAREAFVEGYRETIAGCPSYPDDPAAADALIRLFLIEKLFYEVEYEASHRPGWLRIPINGIRDLFTITSSEEAHGESPS
jgi:maltose alpha-D-glucosyltransferase/alpha-amylase